MAKKLSKKDNRGVVDNVAGSESDCEREKRERERERVRERERERQKMATACLMNFFFIRAATR